MSDAMDRVHSVLWHALLKFADKQRRRKALLDSLPSQYAEDFANHGELQPPGDDAALECAEALISSITLRGTREQAGSVSFQVTS